MTFKELVVQEEIHVGSTFESHREELNYCYQFVLNQGPVIQIWFFMMIINLVVLCCIL